MVREELYAQDDKCGLNKDPNNWLYKREKFNFAIYFNETKSLFTEAHFIR